MFAPSNFRSGIGVLINIQGFWYPARLLNIQSRGDVKLTSTGTHWQSLLGDTQASQMPTRKDSSCQVRIWRGCEVPEKLLQPLALQVNLEYGLGNFSSRDLVVPKQETLIVDSCWHRKHYRRSKKVLYETIYG